MFRSIFIASLIVLAAACGQESAQQCATGIICPADTTCAAAQKICIVNNCGNGVVDPGEQCDDGNIMAGDLCSPSCQREECGNNTQDPQEVCDDGNTTSGD